MGSDDPKERMIMEVRCCCIPKKLLGTVEVLSSTKPGDVVRFAYFEPFQEPKIISLPCAEFSDGLQKYPALKSEETPIETLEKIKGFRKAV